MTSVVERKSTAGERPPRGRHRRARPPFFFHIHRFGAESLFRNSTFLIANLALGAGCGYGSLLVLTHLYSVQAVGLSAAAAAASALIVFIMQFGINYSFPRFLPASHNRSAMINTMFTIIVTTTLLGAAAYLILPFGRRLYPLGGLLFGTVFIIGTCVQAGESTLETIFIADRSSNNVARANVLPNVVKLTAPGAFMFLGTLGAYISRVVSYAVGLVLLGSALAKRGHRFRPALDLSAIRGLGRFSAGMYLASLIGGLPLMVAPLIILYRFGPRQSAYWAIAITIASLLYQLPGTVSQALLPEVASRPSERPSLLRRSAAMILVMVTPVLVFAYVAAPSILALFGHNYPAGSLAILRWLIIAGFITILNYVTGAILFLAKKTFTVIIVNTIDAVIVLGMSAIWAHGAEDVAISWVLGDISNTLLFGLCAFLALRQAGGRWEALGNLHTETEPPVPESSVSSINEQQQGIETLIILAEAQRTGSWTGSYPVPMVRLHDSVGTRGIE